VKVARGPSVTRQP